MLPSNRFESQTFGNPEARRCILKRLRLHVQPRPRMVNFQNVTGKRKWKIYAIKFATNNFSAKIDN